MPRIDLEEGGELPRGNGVFLGRVLSLPEIDERYMMLKCGKSFLFRSTGRFDYRRSEKRSSYWLARLWRLRYGFGGWRYA